MKTYNANQISRQFAELEEKTLAAANNSLKAPHLNEDPALISFDDTETDTVTYDAIRNTTASVLITASGKPEVIDQVIQQATAEVCRSFEQRLRAKMEVL